MTHCGDRCWTIRGTSRQRVKTSRIWVGPAVRNQLHKTLRRLKGETSGERRLTFILKHRCQALPALSKRPGAVDLVEVERPIDLSDRETRPVSSNRPGQSAVVGRLVDGA